MQCKNCGQMLPDHAAFCGYCGAMLTPESAAFSASGSSDAEQTPNPAYIPYAATPEYNVPTAYNPYVETPAEPKKSKKKFVVIAIVAVLLIAVAVLLIVLLNGSGGPLTDISDALMNTVEAGSFTMEARYYRNGELQGGSTLMAECDPKNEVFTMVIYEDDSDNFTAYYDGYYLSRYTSYWDNEVYSYKYDISDEQEEFFEYLEAFEGIDWSNPDPEELLDALDLPKSTIREIEEYIDLDEAQDALETVMGWLNDESWLAENLGYEVSEKKGVTTYSFDLNGKDLRNVLKLILEEFESALDEDVYDELEDDIRGIEKGMELYLELCVEDDCLISAELRASYDGNEYSYVIECSDIGKTEIDTDELERYLRKAESWD